MVHTDSDDDERFSMDALEKDLKRPREARRALWFVAGLVLGIAGSILLPRYAGPYLPFGGGGQLLTGPVLSEERDGERLLLTIEAEPGAFIASFSRRVSEIALLVEPGDTVTISVDDYDPFIEDPDFEGVRKARATRGADVPATPAERRAGEGEPPTIPDSVPADTSGIGRDTADVSGTGRDTADASGTGRDTAGASADSGETGRVVRAPPKPA